MSRNSSDKGPVPPRWLHCPRKSNRPIADKFLAFKTPLSSDYDSQVPEENRFTVNFIFESLKSRKKKMGLWIDLTNTTRFYDRKDVESYGCRYLKLACRGHGETPSPEQTDTFIKICKTFIANNPLEIIGVHCTHGFNRTGFLIISYLVETEYSDVEGGLSHFSIARPPGIYKGDYIQELFKRYSDIDDAPPPPAKPTWCLEYDDTNIEDTDEAPESGTSGQANGTKRKREFNPKNPVFMLGVPNVEAVHENNKVSGIQKRVQQMCGWGTGGFPGSQPVSMDRNNIRLLHEKPYRVSWKADGTRYMLLIQGDGELYFIDRNNSVFEIKGLSFPHPRDITRTLRDTLLDGEMVIDKDNGVEYPRYLAYDVIMYDGRDVSKNSFYPDRYTIIEKEIMGGRHRAMKEGRLRREREPISVRVKQFWELTAAKSLLGEKFAKQLSHEPDGLIFQPANEAYNPGPASDVLKWKPLSMNSVDFKLKIVTESGPGILPRKIGHLYVGGLDRPYGHITSIKGCKELNNKIIECKHENGKWAFMRERTDKTFPNSYNTAQAVCQSIRDPVTTEILLDFIEQSRFVNDTDLMPPPAKRMRFSKVDITYHDRTVHVWCTKDLASKEKKSLRVNIDYDFATNVRVSPDGKAFIIHKSLGNNIEVYGLKKKTNGFFISATSVLEFPKKHEEDIVGMDIACNGRFIMTCSKKNDLVIWDLKGEIISSVDTYLGSTHKARISPCGRFVAASGFTPDVKVWEVGFTKAGEFKQMGKAFDLAGHSSGIYDFDFCADSSQMASVSKDGSYRFYDTNVEFEKGEDPRLLTSGHWENSTPAKAALSPNGEVLAIGHDTSLSFFSTISGQLDTTIEDLGFVSCLTFDASGEYLLVAVEKQIKIFRNIAGYRVAIESAKRKLEQKQSSATKERLEKTIADFTKFLQSMGEQVSR